MTYEYKTKGVCSRSIVIDVEGETVKSVRFIGGCNGNTQGVASLAAGMKIDEVIERLSGINCSGRGTSCPDQLSQALIQIKQQQ